MTVIERALDEPPAPVPPVEPGPSEAAGIESVPATVDRARVILTALAVTSSCVAAAWMVASVFRGISPHLVTLFGVAIGSGLTTAGYIWRRPALTYLAIPAGALAGLIVISPFATGGSSVIPNLVVEAVRSGGLVQPPVPYDPGWQFITIMVFTLLSSGAVSVAIGLNRPKLGVLLPLPMTMAAAVILPPGTAIPSSAVAIALTMAGATAAYGSDLGRDGNIRASFEVPRLLRGAAIALALALAVFVLGSFGFLFPQPNRTHVQPPQRPQVQPQQADRVIFTYTANRTLGVPLRLGVIDVYDSHAGAWELPPVDPARIVRIQPPAHLVGSAKQGQDDLRVTFSMADPTGHSLPDVAAMASVSGPREAIEYDRRTGTIRLADRPAYSGLVYSVTAPPLASGRDLISAGEPEKQYDQFLQVPAPPNEVVVLLQSYAAAAAKLNQPQNSYDRLQYLRTQLYGRVTAAGAGVPVDVGPNRVARILNGSDASPYEISATEALLARWAGVPSRIGYGYYGGTKVPSGQYEIRPKDGSTWLEVYFKGHDWVPIVGVPPKAKPSTSKQQKNQQPIQASDDLTLSIYVATEEPTFLQLYEYVRYYLARILPIVGALALVIACHPWFLKLLRSRKRRRWARARGFRQRIAVGYCEFRDHAYDLTIGQQSATPLDFLLMVDEDEEHSELAWLVSRAMWGDVGRDVRPEDADLAERLSRSVDRRLSRAQPVLNRILALFSRASLREPHSSEIPNIFWEARIPKLRTLVPWRRHRAVRALGAAVGIILTASCLGQSAPRPRAIPENLVPDRLGAIQLTRDTAAEKPFATAGPQSLVAAGRVFLVKHDAYLEGSVQVSLFKPKIDTSDLTDSRSDFCADNPVQCPGHEVFEGVQESFGYGRFQRIYYQGRRAYELQLSDQYVYVWFPPATETMVLLDLRHKFTQDSSDALFHALMDYESGRTPAQVPVPVENS